MGEIQKSAPVLAGCTVLDASTEGVALAGRLLRDLGASVVRLDAGPEATEDAAKAVEVARRKLWSGSSSVAVDLSDSGWAEKLVADVGRVDAVLLELPRADGLDSETIARAFERLQPEAVVVEVSFYGRGGNEQPPLDELLLQAASGILDQTGDPELGVCRLGGQLARTLVSVEAAAAMLAAIRVGRKGHHEAIIRVSAQAALASSSGQPRVTAQLTGEHESSHGGPAIFRGGRRLRLIYRVADGYVTCPYHPTNTLHRLHAWLTEVGRPEATLASLESIIATGVFEADQRAIDTLQADLDQFFGDWTRRDVVEEGQRRGLVMAPINSLHEVAHDPHLAAQGVLRWSAEGDPVIGTPYDISALPAPAEQDERAGAARSDDAVDDSRPLAGVRVIGFTTLLAGPVLGKRLADLGAEVWRIESSSGRAIDFVRNTPPFVELEGRGRVSSVFANVNGGVASIALDMNDPEEAEIVKGLIASADVVIENSRPGLLEKWGLTAEELARLNEDLVVVRMSGMGQQGPWAAHRAAGHTMAAIAGQLVMSGWSDRLPSLTNVPTSDYLAPAFGLLATLAVLEAVDRGEHGYVVDFSQFSGLVYTMLEEVVVAEQGQELARNGVIDPVHPERAAGVFTCSDGRAIAVIDRAWRASGHASVEDWARAIEATASAAPYEAAIATLTGEGRWAAPVLAPAQLTEQESLRVLDYYKPLAGVGNGVELLIDGPPVRFGTAPDSYRISLLGEDTENLVGAEVAATRR